MTPFLEELFNIIGIDVEYLNEYLTPNEMQYLITTLKSIEDLNSDLYSDKQGENLEVLLHFLLCHLEDIELIWEDNSKKEVLVDLYTSGTISGNYDCFRFDLSKFEQTYKPSDQKLTLYRIGRVNENIESLGNSWGKDFTGLRNYAQSSSINVDNRPIFAIEISDSEVLCEGKLTESELILKRDFKCNEIKLLSAEERNEIFM